MNLNLKDIESEGFIFTLFNFLFLVLPGVAIIYVFNNELFVNTDWIKIILVSGSVTVPLVLINTLTLSVILMSKKNNSNSLFISFSLGVILSGLILYTVIALHYIFGTTFKSGVYFTIIIELMLIVAASFHLLNKRNEA